jgi:hypothetical protein
MITINLIFGGGRRREISGEDESAVVDEAEQSIRQILSDGGAVAIIIDHQDDEVNHRIRWYFADVHREFMNETTSNA